MIFDRIFNRRNDLADIKALLDEVTEDNELYRAYLYNLTQGSTLAKDSSMKSYISEGYEKNADVYSIVDRASTMFGQLMKGMKVVQGEDESPVESGELVDTLKQPNGFQVMSEFAKLWESFFLTTGNAITYAPKLEGGNNAGQLMPGGMYMMPTQNIEIIADSWRDPIKYYVLDLNQTEKIPAEQVMHVRMANLKYEDGANFMGMSPIKVAALIIEAENQGYQIVADTLAKGMPPGILTKVQAEYDEGAAVEQQDGLEKAWRSKYGNQKQTRRAGVPVVGAGDIRWIPMGFSNFRDLQIIENNQNGLRILCNVWSMPSIVFNDTEGSTFSNQSEARKAVYTNRLLPDANIWLEYWNAQITPAYGEDLKIILDISDIPELQASRKEQVEWIGMLVNNGTLTRNQALELMKLERSEDPAMDQNLVPFNLMPISDVNSQITSEEADKMMKELKIDDYKYIRNTG